MFKNNRIQKTRDEFQGPLSSLPCGRHKCMVLYRRNYQKKYEDFGTEEFLKTVNGADQNYLEVSLEYIYINIYIYIYIYIYYF